MTVNSDDPAYFGGYIEENFALVEEAAGLGPADLVQLSRNAFHSAWLPRAQRDKYLAALDGYAAR